MLDSIMPCYQVGLRNRLSYELKFNNHNRVMKSSKSDATYKITDISLEYDIVTQPKLTHCIKLRINAGNKDATSIQDNAVADAYGNKFIIPLDFEMLDSAAPYYQAGLGNRLCYKITFKDYN